MLANRQQWCGIASWTARQFDAAVVNGFPTRKKTSSRGDNWQVDTRDGIAWIVEQEVAKPRPRARPAAPPAGPSRRPARAAARMGGVQGRGGRRRRGPGRLPREPAG